jgi:hypothetical protein
MSLPLCYECGDEIDREEIKICEECQKFVCVECFADHECNRKLGRELKTGCREVQRWAWK